MEARFFASLKTANGTFKRTEPNRLDPVNEWLVEQLLRHGANLQEALDLGISSGVTTIELAEALRGAGLDPAITGTDRNCSARLIKVAPGVRALAEPGGHPLQYELLGVPLRAWYRRLDFVNGMAAVRHLAHRLLDARIAAQVAAGLGEIVPLVTPRTARVANLTVVEDDVTSRNAMFERRFDLIRAANLLNRHYFSRDDLGRAIANVRAYLKGPGSFLLVVRTIGSPAHHGSLLRMDEQRRLELVTRYGTGSEIETLLLEDQ
jgi:SAM-dependent methyltransferase